MKATCVMKIGDKWYQAGDEIPSDTVVTKKDIQSMNVKRLREFAAENGLKDNSDYTASELKEKMIEKLGL